MPSVTLTKVRKEQDGTVAFRFGKREVEYPSLAAAKQAVADRFSREDLELIAVGIALSRQPNLGNTAALEGRTVTIDPSLAAWGTIS